MQIGMIGLGRMGGNMVRRLLRGGHECVVFDRNPESVTALASEGATGTDRSTTSSRSSLLRRRPGSWCPQGLPRKRSSVISESGWERGAW